MKGGGVDPDDLIHWARRAIGRHPEEVLIWNQFDNTIEAILRLPRGVLLITICDLDSSDERIEEELSLEIPIWDSQLLEVGGEASGITSIRFGVERIIWSRPEEEILDLEMMILTWMELACRNEGIKAPTKKISHVRQDIETIGRWLDQAGFEQTLEEIKELKEKMKFVETGLGNKEH